MNIELALSRIRCPICEAIGVNSLSVATKDSPYPGEVFRCLSDSCHHWIWLDEKKAILSKDGQDIMASVHADGGEKDDEEEFSSKDFFTIIAAFSPDELLGTIAKSEVPPSEIETLANACKERSFQGRNLEIAISGMTLPEVGEAITVWSPLFKIEARAKAVKHTYIDLSMVSKMENPFLVGIFCEPVSIRSISDGDVFQW